MTGATSKQALVRRLLPLQNRVINPPIRAAIRAGLGPPTYALLETRGRRTGLPRQVPVANGLDGQTFWLISALGRRSAYARNIEADPRVRIKARPARLRDGVGMRWYTGTARLMPGDDARSRQRRLGRGRPGYRLDAVLLRAGAIDMQTIRVDLDAPGAGTAAAPGADAIETPGAGAPETPGPDVAEIRGAGAAAAPGADAGWTP